MRYLLISVFFVLSVPATAQTKLYRDLRESSFGWEYWLNTHSEELPADGKFTVYYDSSFVHIAATGEQKGGLLDGTWTTYYLNGRKSGIEYYRAGKKEGVQIGFSLRGDTTGIFHYKNGVPDGKFTTWDYKRWTPGRYVSSRESYVNGQLNGWQLKFDADGDTTLSAYWQNGVLIGKETTWYQGQVISERVAKPNALGYEYTYPPKPPKSRQTSLYVTLVSYKNMDVEGWKMMDSLKYYSNLRRLIIEIDEAHVKDSVLIAQKLLVLPSLKRLESVGLVGPFRSIPAPIFSCTNLVGLSISGTSSAGSGISSIPSAITKLTKLRALTIGVSRQLDYSATLILLSKCSSLRELNIPLDTGMILPKEISLMKNLYYLSVADWRACGSNHARKLDVTPVYTLTNLRSFGVCWEHYWQIDPFDFAAKLPNCLLLPLETCFTTGALVWMADGSAKSIEKIQVGDRVLSWNANTSQQDTTTVTRALRHYQPPGDLCYLRFHTADTTEDIPGTLQVTALHPFLVDGNWVQAYSLRKGDVVTYCPVPGKIVQVTIDEVETSSERGEYVYNITTASHVYFANGVLVHNK